ncbi:MAG: hypothetical protein ACREV7_22760 [Steroidobacteraceae bacterium]
MLALGLIGVAWSRRRRRNA